MRRYKVTTRYYSGVVVEERKFWRKSSAQNYVSRIEKMLSPWVFCNMDSK